MSKPLFSIITVTLNPGDDLKRTVESVLKQDFRDFELIIKDGGSTDGTEHLQWDDDRIHRITRSDKGIFDAMNQALDLATGEYINFLNAGDLLYSPEVLQIAATAINNHPESVFFFGNVRKPQSRSGFSLYPDSLSRYYLFTHTICHQAWFVHCDTYRKYDGFETDYTTGGDHRLMLKMIVRDNVSYKHISAFVTTYKGNGVSAQSKTIAESRKWRQMLKREIFRPQEYIFYTVAWAGRNMIKRLIYDTIAWRLMRGYRHLLNGI